jgi:hypothetical protein
LFNKRICITYLPKYLGRLEGDGQRRYWRAVPKLGGRSVATNCWPIGIPVTAWLIRTATETRIKCDTSCMRLKIRPFLWVLGTRGGKANSGLLATLKAEK